MFKEWLYMPRFMSRSDSQFACIYTIVQMAVVIHDPTVNIMISGQIKSIFD